MDRWTLAPPTIPVFPFKAPAIHHYSTGGSSQSEIRLPNNENVHKVYKMKRSKSPSPGEGFASTLLRPGHAIIILMEVGNIRLYKDRWQAVEDIERQELRAMSANEHWQKLNAIVRFALETGMEIEKDNGELEIFRRWAKLKSGYEA